MFQVNKKRSFLAYILATIFILTFFSSSIADVQVDSLLEIQEKLIGISEEERAILQELFTLLQEIEAMEREEEDINKEIEIINDEIYDLEIMVEKETLDYEKRQGDLKQVLKSYQRMGAGSYLKIILESESLSMLLRRINTIRDITRNTGKLLEQLDESKEKLEMEKATLSEKLILMEEKKEQLKESLYEKTKIRDSMEKYLASMKEERQYYQDYLNNIQLVWNNLKSTLPKITKEFYRVAKEENLPQDAVKTNFTFSGIKGLIDEKTFNNIIKDYFNLPEMIIKFSQGKIEMTLPEENLILIGDFSILDKNKLKFEVKEGRFYGMPLESSSIEELFREGYIILDLKPMIGNNIVSSVEILEGYIELLIKPVLF